MSESGGGYVGKVVSATERESEKRALVRDMRPMCDGGGGEWVGE